MTTNTPPHPPIVATLTPSKLPPTAATCSEDDIIALVHRFYAKVREDAVLGPIFERHVGDWDAHLALLVDFWSALLRGTRRFKGSPVTRHLALPGLNANLFRHWLALFTQTTSELNHPSLKAEADEQAAMIAERLWRRYQDAHPQS